MIESVNVQYLLFFAVEVEVESISEKSVGSTAEREGQGGGGDLVHSCGG